MRLEPSTTAQTALGDDLANMALEAISENCLPMRPGFGEIGKKIVLRTNYYRLELNKDQLLYRYSVDIRKPGKQDQEPMSKREKRSVLEDLLREREFSSLNNMYATDWASMIITTSKVTLSDGGTKNRKAFDIADGPTPSVKFSVLVEETRRFHLKELLDYVMSPSPQSLYAIEDDVIQVLNIVLSKIPEGTANIGLIGRNKYYPMKGHALYDNDNRDLGAAIEAIRGYYTSVRIATGRVLVNVNVATTAVYKALPLSKLMLEFYKSGNTVKDLDMFLKGLKVEMSHLRDKNGKPRVKVICGLARRPDNKSPGDSSEFRFPIDEELTGRDRNGQITVRNYFEAKYHVRDPDTGNNAGRWVVKVGDPKKNNYLPPYVCTVIPGQPVRRMLSGLQQSGMIDFACRPAPDNAEAIQSKGRRVMGFNTPGKSLKDFGVVQVEKEMLTVPGRILEGPAVLYKEKVIQVEDGRWNLKGVKFRNAKLVSGWVCLFINESGENSPKSPSSFEGGAQAFTEAIRENFPPYGVRVHPPHSTYKDGATMEVNLRDEDDINNKLDWMFSDFKKKRVQFVFVLLPQKHTYLYTRIKFFADVKSGIHTVNMVGSKLRITNQKSERFGQIDRQYLANIALKVNLKLGGVNHEIKPSDLAPLDRETMIVGIDVTHPSPGSRENAPSIAGVVASFDLTLAQWPASIRLQTGRKEMVGGTGNEILRDMLKERLKFWQGRHNQTLPKKLLIYRDGVSEGQYDSVLRDELPQIMTACKEMYPAKVEQPKVTIIVVGKRHHTRFYPTTVQDTDGTAPSNPKNGTVVDRGVTMAKHWDFFLQAHRGLKGTARPAHYFIIKDGIGFGKDNIQTLVGDHPTVSQVL